MDDSVMTASQKRATHVSPTTLNLLRDCERCFWLHYHGMKRPAGPWPTITRGLDTVISHYCAPYRASGTLPPLLQQLEGGLVAVHVKRWVDPETGLTLSGRLDECLETDSGQFAPLDHKTRGWAPNGVHDAYKLQLDAYSLLLAESGYPPAGYGVLAYWFPMDGQLHEGFPFEVHIHRVQTDADWVRDWLGRARAVLDLSEPPEAAPECAYCRWAMDVAPYG